MSEMHQYHDFVDEFAEETSDRAAVIMGSAKLDAQLYLILKRELLATTTERDELLDGDNPLSSFSARAKIAYRLRLIDKDLFRALDLIRRIRNAFAHQLDSKSLTADDKSNQVQELARLFASVEVFMNVKEVLKGRFQIQDGPALDFRVALAATGSRLEKLIHHPEPPGTIKCWPLIDPAWR
jgi:hypothetical protein